MATTTTTYQFSATVESPESQSATDSQPFTVTSSSGGTSTAIFGATLTGASNLQQSITNWENLVEPIGCQKIYFQKGSNPPPTTVAGASNHVQVAAALGIPVILCFEPTVTGSTNDATWAGGADKPAQGTFATGHTGTIQGDLFDAIATVNGLSAASQANPLNVLGACMWQEADNDHNYIPNGGTAIASVDQYTYLYYQWYTTFKTHCPTVLLGQILTGYNNPYATNAQLTSWIPGPTALMPSAVQYTDFLMVDVYATGYHNFKYTPYQNGPGNAPNTGQAGNLWDIADYINANGTNPCAAGWSEFANSAGGIDPGQQYMTAYISSNASLTPFPGDPDNSIQAHYAYRVSNDLPCMPAMWYTAENAAGTASVGPNGIFNSGDYRIPLLKGLYTTMSGS